MPRLGQTAVAAIVDLQLFAIPRKVLEVIAIRNTSEIAINCNRRRDRDEDLQLIAIDRSSDTYPKRGTNSNWPLLPPCPCAERRHPTTTDSQPFGIQVGPSSARAAILGLQWEEISAGLNKGIPKCRAHSFDRGHHFRLDHARLYDRPARKPPVDVAGDPGSAQISRRVRSAGERQRGRDVDILFV